MTNDWLATEQLLSLQAQPYSFSYALDELQERSLRPLVEQLDTTASVRAQLPQAGRLLRVVGLWHPISALLKGFNAALVEDGAPELAFTSDDFVAVSLNTPVSFFP
jgi:hypothetical protein